MIFEKLQALKSKLTEIQNRITKVRESSEVLISYKREKIHKLQEQIEGIIIKRNDEITGLCNEEKEALADCQSELEEASVYGTYVVDSLMPILADISKRIIAKDIDYGIYGYRAPACTVIDRYNTSYSFEVLVLSSDSSFEPWIIAESPKPKEIALLLNGKPYAKRSHFAETHQFAQYDAKEGRFNFREISVYAINNTPPYIKDFICYASNYRLEHDLKEISEEELKELAEKFLAENKEKYNGQVRNLKK